MPDINNAISLAHFDAVGGRPPQQRQCRKHRIRESCYRPMSAANIGPNRFHYSLTVSWQRLMPRSNNKSSTLRSDSGNRTYIITTMRITSGDEWKYRNGFAGFLGRGLDFPTAPEAHRHRCNPFDTTSTSHSSVWRSDLPVSKTGSRRRKRASARSSSSRMPFEVIGSRSRLQRTRDNTSLDTIAAATLHRVPRPNAWHAPPTG